MFDMMRQVVLAESLVDGAIRPSASTPIAAHADEANPFKEKAAGYVQDVGRIWQRPSARRRGGAPRSEPGRVCDATVEPGVRLSVELTDA